MKAVCVFAGEIRIWEADDGKHYAVYGGIEDYHIESGYGVEVPVAKLFQELKEEGIVACNRPRSSF